jgi:hypothetical protein
MIESIRRSTTQRRLPLIPLYQLMKNELLSSNVIGSDDTKFIDRLETSNSDRIGHSNLQLILTCHGPFDGSMPTFAPNRSQTGIRRLLQYPPLRIEVTEPDLLRKQR